MHRALAFAACLLVVAPSARATETLPSFINLCWNFGSLSSEALEAVIVVSFQIDANGIPDPDSIELVGSRGSEGGAKQAFEVARRAILRCSMQKGGLPFPGEKVTLIFGPDDEGDMSIRVLPQPRPTIIEAVASPIRTTNA